MTVTDVQQSDRVEHATAIEGDVVTVSDAGRSILVDSMTADERLFAVLYWAEELRFNEIGDVTGWDRETVQRHWRACCQKGIQAKGLH